MKDAIKGLNDIKYQIQSSLDEVDVDSDAKEAEADNKRLVNALNTAIRSLNAWDKLLTEVKSLFYEAPAYTPNYDAYKKFLMIIDKYVNEVSE